MLEICAKFVQSKNEHCEQKELYSLYIKHIMIQNVQIKNLTKFSQKNLLLTKTGKQAFSRCITHKE